MEKYFLIAINEDKPTIIDLEENYVKDNAYKYSLAYIDYLTSRYDALTFKRILMQKGIIDSFKTEIVIGHLHKYKGKEFVKFYEVLNRGSDSYLVDNLALTTIRNRDISLCDAGYLLENIKNYYCNDEFKDILRFYLSDDEINFLISDKTKSKRKLSYNALRNAVCSLENFHQFGTFEEYYLNNYINNHVLPIESIKYIIKENSKTIDYEMQESVIKSQSELLDSEWDNPMAKEEFAKDYYREPTFRTLTLEDRLRAGLIDYIEYKNVVRSKTKKRVINK